MPKRPTKPVVGKTKYFTSLVMDEEKYFLGDSVRVNEKSDDERYANICKIFKKNNEYLALVRWHLKPTEVFEELPEFVGEAELFDSESYQVVPVESIYDKIYIIPFEKYFQAETVDTDTFYIRATYQKTQTFKPDFAFWPRNCLCQKIINPDLEFVRCDSCEDLFHFECVGYEPTLDVWVCPNH